MATQVQNETGRDTVVGPFVAWSDRKNSPGWIVDGNGCHIWTGSRQHNGYGHVRVDGRTQMVHRVRYEREVGPIPDGLELDHYVCSNGPGGCCNPHHCRPATRRENTLRGNSPTARNARKTNCKRGHKLAGDNLLESGLREGKRQCRACRRLRDRWRRPLPRFSWM